MLKINEMGIVYTGLLLCLATLQYRLFSEETYMKFVVEYDCSVAALLIRM